MDRDEQSVNHPERTVAFSRQGWRCLGDDIIAAYLDGGLDAADLRKTQSHLADCQACRSLVVDVVAIRRLETSQLPLGLKERAFSTALSPRPKRSLFVPAFATAGIACVVLAAFLVEAPQRLKLTLPKPPTAPMIAKSDLPPAPRDSNADVVRKLAQPQSTPTILFPVENATLRRSQLRFSWKHVARAQYYEIHLVTTEGDPVWGAESKTNSLDLPTDFALSDGAYFVWIDAVTNGQIRKSVPVRFLVRTSP